VESYDPLSAEAKQNSHKLFAQLRQTCPLDHHTMPPTEIDRQNASYMVAEPTEEFWSVFRYADILRILRDPQTYSNKEGPGPERMVQLDEDGMLLFADDPAHQRQRHIANKAFLPRMVEQRLPVIKAVIDEIIDRLEPVGHADVVQEMSIPLTVAVITDIFGVGADRREDIARWGPVVMEAMGGDAQVVEAAAVATLEMFAFVGEEIKKRRETLEGGGTLPNDVLSALIQAEHEGSGFTDNEILMAANQFLVAGYETTATAIGNAIWLFCTHPEERDKLLADWSLLDNAIEEILRYEPPVEGTFRSTTGPVRLLDTDLPARAKVRVVYASANRDEAQFTDPHEFRIERPVAELRRHLAFGNGTHSCLGAALARAEMRIALRAILERLPELRLDSDRPAVRSSAFTVNGFTSVPVVWTPGKRP
jgi:cytochrome P450